MSMLSVKDLSFSYQNKLVIEDFSLNLNQNENVGLIGANGAGKSTFLKLLVGLLEYTKGQIEVDGNLVNKKNYPLIRNLLGYVFQDSDNQLFLSTVFDDVAFGPKNYNLSKEEVLNRVDAALDLVNMKDFKDRLIYTLSGGEKKLVAIASILSLTPKMMLLDEPSVALDPKNRRNLIEILNSVNISKIIASHDLDMILDTCPRTILINKGKIVADGETLVILSNKQMLEENGLLLPLSLTHLK